MSQGSALLTLSAIDKRFDVHRVLDAASFELAEGEVHALLGENGAGKSTLMNILIGVYSADAGTLTLDGQPLRIAGPADSARQGIGMVHQHFRLVDRLTLTENLLLAADDRPALQRRSAARETLLATAREVGFTLDPDCPVGELSVAEKQRAEICKVLALGARILILDEPTAVLTDAEATAMLGAIRRMAASGRSIILITHKLREVVGFSHRVTIMRRGETVAAGLDTATLSIEKIASLMMGTNASRVAPDKAPGHVRAQGPDLLAVAHLHARRDDGAPALADVSLRVRAGEILGLAGVGGNGQHELVETLCGLRSASAGSVMIDGADALGLSPRKRRRLGLRVIPADRMATALVSELDIAANLALTSVVDGRFGQLWLDRRRMARDARGRIEQHEIAGARPRGRMGLLSGGNAQKVLLAREIDTGMKLLLAHSPTRGLDIRAAAAVHRRLREAAADGAACLLVSEDVEEIMALSDRICVISAGRITGELPGDACAADIGRLILGHE
ncbi:MULTISPECIES: ABC transporter ATP-binding protein [unclassified Modicisalibacter]|uniref:ABC transporter ATP-binding protein n=1 Tax=unclassified Modicisalibacter TaxID=2679913 RepID=UPI001CCC3DE2|nr:MULTISPECIES: ABC transporter ATP-binding protein [unclassified Modicisalibacter]MBZ9556460.1 ABC transporter ATP-binding protein [Modicisalibacter sp. R2A 31.J]MBZ9575071.1 ABC transporter ATP-binding protein [Modicisalibacter sp. MOD 31.J]